MAATVGQTLSPDWWRGTQFDVGGQFVAPSFTGQMQTPSWAQNMLQQGNAPGGLVPQQMSYSPVNRNDPVYSTYGQGGRAGDAFNGQTAGFELNQAMRGSTGLNNGRIYLNYTQDPKTGQYVATPAGATLGEAEQNRSTGVGLAQAAKFVIPRALAMIAAAEGGAAAMGGDTGTVAAGAGSQSFPIAEGAATGGETGASGLASAASPYAGSGFTGDAGSLAGAAEGTSTGAEASGGLLSQMTPQQIASAAQRYGPTAIKALGLIGGGAAASHVANSQQPGGGQIGPQVPAWNYQQQPIAPGSAFGGGMFGQNPMMGMQRGYQFGAPGQQMPQMGMPQPNMGMPQPNMGMWGQQQQMPQPSPSQRAMQQYQQGLFQQHSQPGGFFGFQAPQATQQQQITPQMLQHLLGMSGPQQMQTQPGAMSPPANYPAFQQPRPMMYGGRMGGK